MQINNTQALERAGEKWLVLRVEGDGFAVNQYYPRYSYGPSAADAVDNMYTDSFRPSGLKDFLVVPLDGAELLSVKPKRNVLVFSGIELF